MIKSHDSVVWTHSWLLATSGRSAEMTEPLVFLILGFIPLWQSQNSIRASPEHEDSPHLSLMTYLLIPVDQKHSNPESVWKGTVYKGMEIRKGKFSEGLAVNALPCPVPVLLSHFFSHCLLRTYLCSFFLGIMILCYWANSIFNYNISRIWEYFILTSL